MAFLTQANSLTRVPHTAKKLLPFLLAIAVVTTIGLVFVLQAVSDAESVRRQARGDHYAVTVELDKASADVVNADITVKPTSVDEVWLSAAMPDMGHSTPEIRTDRTAPGRFHGQGKLFEMTGVWELAVRIQGSAGNENIPVRIIVGK